MVGHERQMNRLGFVMGRTHFDDLRPVADVQGVRPADVFRLALTGYIDAQEGLREAATSQEALGDWVASRSGSGTLPRPRKLLFSPKTSRAETAVSVPREEYRAVAALTKGFLLETEPPLVLLIEEFRSYDVRTPESRSSAVLAPSEFWQKYINGEAVNQRIGDVKTGYVESAIMDYLTNIMEDPKNASFVAAVRDERVRRQQELERLLPPPLAESSFWALPPKFQSHLS